MAGTTPEKTGGNATGNTGNRLYEMLKNDLMTDVIFVVQDTEIRCHQAVLASYGGYLSGLLSGCTTSYAKWKKIQLEDEKITPQALRTILQYIYTGNCDVNWENVTQVIHAAKEFNMEFCVAHCVGLIKQQSKDESQELQHAANNLNEVYESLVAGNWADTRGLSQVSREYFQSNAKKIIQDEKYLNFSSDVLELFCSTEGTGCSQKELFELCIVWAKRQCRVNKLKDTPTQLRSLLSEVLKKLRFAEMSTQEFMDYVFPTFILNNEEVGKVIAERRKMAEDTRVKVLIKNHYSDDKKAIEVQLSTKILELKKLDFFKKMVYSYLEKAYMIKFELHHDFFTLSHKDKVLSDDTCLESIYTPGEQLVLEVHSITYNVKVMGTDIVIPIAIEGKKCSKAEKIIKSHLHCFHDIHPDDVGCVGIWSTGLPWGENHEVDVNLHASLPRRRFIRDLDTFFGGVVFSLILLISIIMLIFLISVISTSQNLETNSPDRRLEL